ncbi:glycosyltransferase [Arthrobacter sp. A5]|uniref:glycosyltransferase n=1 Tax=Arthrobacter sp. A5 TaxID=576926 RepID=UPI003DA84A00
MTHRRTAAVVSLYNPDASVLDNVGALLRQVDVVIAVDDGSSDDPTWVLAQLATLGCRIVRLATNSGIAAALNAGIAAVCADRAAVPAFILTMDQDSRIETGYVDKLVTAFDQATAADVAVGMVAPGRIRGLGTRRSGHVGPVVLGGEPIQSGLLIPVTVLDRLGPLMSELFIDGVDTEFYLRCRTAGYQVVIAETAGLDHSLGSMRPVEFLGWQPALGGKPVLVRTAAAYRYYYIFRNRQLLVNRYWLRQPGWAVKGILADCRHLMIVSLLVPGRLERLKNVVAGARDGRHRVTGPRLAR